MSKSRRDSWKWLNKDKDRKRRGQRKHQNLFKPDNQFQNDNINDWDIKETDEGGTTSDNGNPD